MRRNKAIICVDDDRLILQSLKSQLSDAFYSAYIIEAAESAEEALEAIDFLAQRNVKTVMMICDWLMPDIRGDQLLVEAYKRFPNMTTIMLSGQADEAAVRRAYEKGNLNDFLAKPWEEEELIEKIKKLLPTER
ncbi:MAG: response regulator [Bernardetiaceae bacterium]|nr:response regulator [Bernardetiaceae bacterium]